MDNVAGNYVHGLAVETENGWLLPVIAVGFVCATVMVVTAGTEICSFLNVEL
jgi:hypothetical protein